MRRDIRFASTAAATGALITSAIAALAAAPHAHHSHATPVAVQQAAQLPATPVDVEALRLRAKAVAEQQHVATLRSAVARAHANIVAEAARKQRAQAAARQRSQGSSPRSTPSSGSTNRLSSSSDTLRVNYLPRLARTPRLTRTPRLQCTPQAGIWRASRAT
jgi:hypothetical protein